MVMVAVVVFLGSLGEDVGDSSGAGAGAIHPPMADETSALGFNVLYGPVFLMGGASVRSLL